MMRTTYPVLKRGGLFWDQALRPREACEETFRAVQALVAESGDDVWIVFGDLDRSGDLVRASHFMPRTRFAVVMVPQTGEPTVLAAIGSRDVPAMKTLTWVEDLRPFASLSKAVLTWIAEAGLRAGRIGLLGVEEGAPVKEWDAVREGLPDARFTCRSAAMASLRRGVEPWQRLAQDRASAAIVTALDAVPPALRDGQTVRQVVAAVDRLLRRAAAEDVRILVAGGTTAGTALGPATDEFLSAGDSLLLFVRVQVQRVWSEAARTFVVGEPRSEQQALASDAELALKAMQAVLRDGARAESVADAALRKLGDGALARSATGYGLGAAVGLDPEEQPIVRPGNHDVFAAGQRIALRVLGHRNGCGVATGGVFEVGETGSRALIDTPLLVEVGGRAKLHETPRRRSEPSHRSVNEEDRKGGSTP